jgi:hypothetical protein
LGVASAVLGCGFEHRPGAPSGKLAAGRRLNPKARKLALGKGLLSLKIRVGDALKWLAEQHPGQSNQDAALKKELRMNTRGGILVLSKRGQQLFRAIPAVGS